MKQRDRDRVSAKLTRDDALEFAAYLIINTYDAKCAAEALMDKGLFGQARSMAILALEECGKISPTLSFIANPAGRPNYIDECFGHRSKQMRGHLLMSIAPVVFRSGDFTKDHGEGMGGFVKELENRFDADLVERELLPMAPELQEIINRGESGAIEEDRQDGLYVSYAIDQCDKVSVRHPHQVSRADAQKILDVLAIYSDQSLESIFEC